MSDILLGKLATEFKTVKAMVEVYCKDHHGTKGELCAECRELLEYAEVRLDRCPYGEDKRLATNVRFTVTSQNLKNKCV